MKQKQLQLRKRSPNLVAESAATGTGSVVANVEVERHSFTSLAQTSGKANDLRNGWDEVNT